MATINLPELLELSEEEAAATVHAVVESFLYKDIKIGIRQLVGDCNGKERAFYAGYVLGRLTGQRNPEMD